MSLRHFIQAAAVLVALCIARPSAAQPAVPTQERRSRFEIAAQASFLRLTDFDTASAGLGGRLSFDLTRWVGLEGSITFFPRDRIESPGLAGADFRLFSERWRTDALLGVRVGRRGEGVGVFATVLPGITRLTEKRYGCEGVDCARALILAAPNTYRTELAVNLGGGVEFALTPRTVARVDVGDTIIRHRSVAPPCPTDACTSHNLASRVGFGYRF